MPFPLAHPAAVLPLRRWCPQFFNFPALVVGSICPDAGYCFGRRDIEEFSHRLTGSIGFCLPVGLLLLGLFYGLRSTAVGLLPERNQKIFLPLCQRPIGSPASIISSLLVGIWTHLLWDSGTQVHGWLAEHWTVLQTPLAVFGDQTLRIQHLVWYGCSFGGIAWIYFAYEQWKQFVDGAGRQTSNLKKWQTALWVALLFVPVEGMHHLIYGSLGLFLVAGASGILVVCIALKTTYVRPGKI